MRECPPIRRFVALYDLEVDWPQTRVELIVEQERLAGEEPDPWAPGPGPRPVGGCFVCPARNKEGAGAQGDPVWAGAALLAGGAAETAVHEGEAGAAYEPGLLGLREGPGLEAAVRALPSLPAVLLVDSTGRDHPRRAGLALHLGAILDVPTVGVTHRPLLASGEWPALGRGKHSPLSLDGETVGYWLVTRDGTRPLAVHAAWRTDPELAVRVVLAVSSSKARTPEPLRLARRAAREARAADARRYGAGRGTVG